MGNVGSATRRVLFRTPVAAPLIVAVLGLSLVAIPPDPAESAGARSNAETIGGRPGRQAGGGRTVDDEDVRGSIAGVVVGTDGRRHLGVIVRLHRAATEDDPEVLLRPAFTGVDGRYRFDDLAPGCYRVVVDAPAGTSFTDGADSEDHLTCVGERLEVTVGSTAGAAPAAADAGPAPSPELRSVTTPEGGAAPSTSAFEIVHIGHHLGQLAPSTIDLELAGATVEAEVGGWPRVVAAIEAARPIDAPESTITVNTGGVLAGSELAHLFGGAADAALFNRACFDYLAPSPEDRARDDEWDTFLRFLDDDHCSTTVLDPGPGPSTNRSTPDPAVALHPVGSATVALVAVGSEVDDEAARERIEEAVEAGASTVVVLSGLGLAADRELAGRLPAVDAIVGSGAGSLLGPLDDLGLATSGPYPDRAVNAEGDPVCLGHAGDRARAIGVLRVEVDEDGRVVGCGGRIELLVGRHAALATGTTTIDEDGDAGDDNDEGGGAPAEAAPGPTPADIDRALARHPALTLATPDLATSRSLARWDAVLDVLLDDPVATVTDDLCHTGVPGRSVGFLCGTSELVTDTTAPRADVQQLVADAFRHRAGELGRSAIALIDSATAHGGIDAGSLTVAEAYELLPTVPGATLALVDLSGAELVAIIEERLAAAIAGTPGAYPHASGLRFTPDLSVPGRATVGPIEALDDNGSWRAIETTARYPIVTTRRLLADETNSPTLAAAATSETMTGSTVGTAEALLDYVDDVLDGHIGAGLSGAVGRS